MGEAPMQTVQEVEKHVPVREGDYGERVATVEPGGVEYISLKERHGKPIDLFWTWLSPNLEFATVFVGVLGVAVFGLSFWLTALAIVLGSALGSLTHYVLSSWGRKFGGFMLLFTATFGYAAGWNPYAADYTRYLPPTVNRAMVGFWAAMGVFVSCVVIELAGAALATVAGTKWGPTDIPTVQLHVAMPDLLYYLTLLCIAVGAVCANAINIYSGTMSLVALGIREMGLTLRQRRALLAVIAGVLGYIIGIVGQANVGPGSKYEYFLLLISYWIAPWLAVVLVDYWLRKGDYGDESMFYDTKYQRWQGVAAMAIGLVVSVGLFANVYSIYTGPIPNGNPGIGDITFIVGVVLAGVRYYAFNMMGP